jgi:peptide/nickel transport system substrate-binding protein
MRKALSVLALVAGCGLLAASALAGSEARSGGTFRVAYTVDIDHVDPALAYYVPSWVLEYATGAMLLSYPDAPAPRGSRLIPEVAAGFPAISKDGKTHTFRLRRNYRFSDGRPVTAASFARAIERARDRSMKSPAARFVVDVTSVQARGYTLRIRTRRPVGDLAARLALPFFMAVPPDTPINAEGIQAPVVSAGPYFIREWTKNRRIVLERNRFYRGPRPHRVDRIVVGIGLPLEEIKLRIDRGRFDWGDIPTQAHAELGQRFGVKRRSPGRYFANPASTVIYLAINHDRPLFGGPTPLGNVPLKQAVNFAVDRADIIGAGGAYSGVPSDQLLPPLVPGFKDARMYPRRPDLDRARELARGNLRSGKGTFYCTNRAPGPHQCQIIQANLRRIGLEMDILPPRRNCPWGSCDTDRRGEPFDLMLEAWHADFFDPYNFLFLVDGTTIQPAKNTNLSYFNHPRFNQRLQAARALTGNRRYAAFSKIDHDLMRTAAPVAVIGNRTDRHYVSPRTGCYHYQPVYTFDLAAICLKR